MQLQKPIMIWPYKHPLHNGRAAQQVRRRIWHKARFSTTLQQPLCRLLISVGYTCFCMDMKAGLNGEELAIRLWWQLPVQTATASRAGKVTQLRSKQTTPVTIR